MDVHKTISYLKEIDFMNIVLWIAEILIILLLLQAIGWIP